MVVVREVRFVGDLGVSERELQEYMEFLKGHSAEESKVLKQSADATRKALQHHGFLKAEVAPSVVGMPHRAASGHDIVLQLAIHSGQQYRVKDISFSGLASEFSSKELKNAIHLGSGDIADLNEIVAGIETMKGLFKNKGKDYVVIPELTFDDSTKRVSITFHIQE
jgi:outer membrane protein assembly factor BamA